MEAKELILRELVKHGYSIKGERRIWDISDSKLWFLTPDLGKGFLALGSYAPYRNNVITRELALLKQNAEKIVNKIGKREFNLVEMGSNDGEKAEAFIRALPKDVKLRYAQIGVNEFLLGESEKRIRAINSPNVTEVKPFVSEWENMGTIVDALTKDVYKNNLIFLLGSTLTTREITSTLFNLCCNMHDGDLLVIGNGIRVGERFRSLEKYRHVVFRNWYFHIMKELGFNENEIEYDARFTSARLEMLFRCRTDKTISYKNMKMAFKRGDEVVVGIWYKYYENELVDFCKMYFRDVEVIKDPTGNHALFLCRK
jgi:uncharacterized SAM-dependent methyltransferase